eukprot:SAG25_NODE_2346_length_1697_cov_1.194618_1_plen_177_part_00
MQVRTAPEAERAERAALKAQREAGGGNAEIARKPTLRRSAHTLTARFWSDERPLGLTLELEASRHLASRRFVRIVSVAPNGLAAQLKEGGMPLEAIEGEAACPDHGGGATAPRLEEIYAALRRRPLALTFGAGVQEQLEEEEAAKTALVLRSVREAEERMVRSGGGGSPRPVSQNG